MSFTGFSLLLFMGAKLGAANLRYPEATEKLLDDVASAGQAMPSSLGMSLPPPPGAPVLISPPPPPDPLDENDYSESDEGELPLPELNDIPVGLPPLSGADEEPEGELTEEVEEMFPPLLPLEESGNSVTEDEEVSAVDQGGDMEDDEDDEEGLPPLQDSEVSTSEELPATEMMLPSLPLPYSDEDNTDDVPPPVIEEKPGDVTYIPPPPVSEEEVLLMQELEESEADASSTLETSLDNEIELVEEGQSLFLGLTDDMAEDPTQKLIEEIKVEPEPEPEEVQGPGLDPEVVEEAPYQKPYDNTKDPGKKDYKVQKLPKPVSSKAYNKDNQHLPKAVYNEDHYKMFFVAAMNGNLKGLHALRPYIEDIDAQDASGDTPLIKAILSGRIKSVRFLLANNANPDILNKSGVAGLHIAASMNRPDIIDALKAKSVNLYIKDSYDREPYMYAMHKGYWGLLSQLVDAEFNPDEKLESGDYKIISAIKMGSAQYVQFLLEHGANPNVRDRQQYTPLMLAAYNGQSIIVESLLRHSADIFATDSYNRDAEILARTSRYTSIAQRIATEKVTKTLQYNQ